MKPYSIQIAEHLPIDKDLMNQTEIDTGWQGYLRWRIREMILKAELVEEFSDLLDARRSGFQNNFQRIVYTESHDEERFLRELHEAGYSTEESLRRVVQALALTVTIPGVTMVYAGQEFDETAKRVVVPNPLNWEHLDRPEYKRLHVTATKLFRLRTQNPALCSEDVNIIINDRQKDLLWSMKDQDHRPV